MQWRIEVRNAQDAGISAIRDALGEEYGPDFERRAMQKAFPMVYRPDPVTPLLEGAMALPDLTDAQRAQLETLSQEFTTEFDGVRGQLVAAYRETEPQEPRRRTELAKRRAAGEQTRLTDPPAVEQAKGAREDLFTKYRLRITEILTAEQKQAVPGLVKADAEAQRKPVPGREQKLSEGQVPDGDFIEHVEGGKGGKGAGGKPANPANPATEGFGTSPGGGAPKRAD